MGIRVCRASGSVGSFVLLLVLLPVTSLFAAPANRPAAPRAPASVAPSRVFVENAGQWPRDVLYNLHGAGYGLFFTATEARFALPDGRGKAFPISLHFPGSRPADVVGEARQPGKVNVLVGTPDRWRTNLTTYARLVYRELWPGIDMAFTPRAGHVKYEYRLAAGADADRIRLRYDGATGLAITADGGLDVATPAGTLHDAPPEAYQDVAGRTVPVPVRFVLEGGRQVALSVGDYNRARPLVIDPGIVFSTYVGGQWEERPGSMAIAFVLAPAKR
jgi:hypothetical protein